MTLQSIVCSTLTTVDKVVTHQHSGDPAIVYVSTAKNIPLVVTHQHSGDPAIELSHDQLLLARS